VSADSKQTEFQVNIFKPLAAPYWIIDLVPNYQFAVSLVPLRTSA